MVVCLGRKAVDDNVIKPCINMDCGLLVAKWGSIPEKVTVSPFMVTVLPLEPQFLSRARCCCCCVVVVVVTLVCRHLNPQI